jgi:hypothetical protein
LENTDRKPISLTKGNIVIMEDLADPGFVFEWSTLNLTDELPALRVELNYRPLVVLTGKIVDARCLFSIWANKITGVLPAETKSNHIEFDDSYDNKHII